MDCQGFSNSWRHCGPMKTAIVTHITFHIYHDAGQYYWYRVSAFMENPNILTQCPIPIITPETEVQDIDTEEDWELAEMKFRLLKRSHIATQ